VFLENLTHRTEIATYKWGAKARVSVFCG